MVAGPTAAACRAKSEEDYGKANLVQQGDRLTVSVCIVVMRKPLPRLICGGLKDWLAGRRKNIGHPPFFLPEISRQVKVTLAFLFVEV